MTATEEPVIVLIKIVIFHFILPAVITLGVSKRCVKSVISVRGI